MGFKRLTQNKLLKSFAIYGEKGSISDIAAGTLGVKWVERHFTLDRTMKGPDHAASMQPEEFKLMVRAVAEGFCICIRQFPYQPPTIKGLSLIHI